MKKKLTLMATAVALGALVVVGATMAYFTSQDTATNVITTGNVKIEINETSPEGENLITGKFNEGEEEKGIQFEGTFTPGQKFSKVPTIKNTGNNPAFVRAKVNYTYYKLNDQNEWVVTQAPSDGADVTGIDSKWELKDDYYYYNEALAKGSTTTSLFTQLVIPTSWGENEQNMRVEVVVSAEAIQSENNNENGVYAAFKNYTTTETEPSNDTAPSTEN